MIHCFIAEKKLPVNQAANRKIQMTPQPPPHLHLHLRHHHRHHHQAVTLVSHHQQRVQTLRKRKRKEENHKSHLKRKRGGVLKPFIYCCVKYS